MARIVEQMIAIKLSRIIKDHDAQTSVLSEKQYTTLLASIPELAQSIVDDTSIVVEVIEIE